MVRTAGRYLRQTHVRSMHSTSGICVCCLASNDTKSICTEWWCMEANESTQTHGYNPVAPAYPIWAYYVHGQQCRCQEDPVSLPSGRLEKTTRSSPHHVAQHHPTGSVGQGYSHNNSINLGTNSFSVVPRPIFSVELIFAWAIFVSCIFNEIICIFAKNSNFSYFPA